jgi:hypothetical protein
MTISEVEKFILTASIADIKILQEVINFKIKQNRGTIKAQFKVGDLVKINHARTGDRKFKIIKINQKNIKVEDIDGKGKYTVSPSLLEII